jgi:hypothetical protein
LTPVKSKRMRPSCMSYIQLTHPANLRLLGITILTAFGNHNKTTDPFIKPLHFSLKTPLVRIFSSAIFKTSLFFYQRDKTMDKIKQLWLIYIELKTSAENRDIKEERKYDSSVSSTTLGWTTGFRFPAGAVNFSLRHRVQTDSGPFHPAYLMGTGGSFPGNKAAGAWSWPLTCIYRQR